MWRLDYQSADSMYRVPSVGLFVYFLGVETMKVSRLNLVFALGYKKTEGVKQLVSLFAARVASVNGLDIIGLHNSQIRVQSISQNWSADLNPGDSASNGVATVTYRKRGKVSASLEIRTIRDIQPRKVEEINPLVMAGMLKERGITC